ncbi:MAG: efflux RND transporter permease subunit [Candidatus Eremiobacteraeota bacterium]|nr:efflux RND transporter permease subunit [Candidatus Eremiobacteraeota bacterium]
MNDRKLSLPAWALANPHAVTAAYIGLVMAAIAAALFILPTRMMPYVESPQIAVVTMLPGYSPQDAETFFSKPIEERMTDLKDVRYVRSTSQQGLSIVTLQFQYGTDMRRALMDAQQLVQQAQADLPYDKANLKPSWVIPVDPLNTPVLQLAVTGVGWNLLQLRQFVANEVVDQLKMVPGVQTVQAFGGEQRQLQVVVDRTKLAAYGLSLVDVKNALDAQNISRSAGTISDANHETLVVGVNRVLRADDVRSFPLSTANGRTVYARDVATIFDGAAERRSAYDFNGKEAVEVSVVENPNASSPQVIVAIMSRIAQMEQAHPGMKFEPAYDNSRFVADLKKNMLEELLVSVILAGLVLLVFLEDVSATLIVMTAIPTCLGLAVLLFVPMGFSINSSTLVGLLLAIGRLVDDSIVVIHAVHRNLRAGKSPARAAVDGTMEVVLPIAAATGVMILAVVPLLTSGGITQIMFVGLVWPIVFALLASLLVSLTLTPLLAAHLFYGIEQSPPAWRTRIDSAVARALDRPRRGLARIEDGYKRGLRWSLENKVAVLGGAAIATYLGIGLYPLIGSEMMPLADTGQASAYVAADAGTSFTAMRDKSARFEKILLAQPEIERISAEIGEAAGGTYFSGQSMNGVNEASYLITLRPKENRARSIWQVMDAVYAQASRTVPGLRRIALKEMGADVMSTTAAPVELVVYGPNLGELHRLAEGVAGAARAVPGLVQASTSSAIDQPEVRLIVDRTRASQVGLTPYDVLTQAYYAIHGGLSNEYFNPENLRHSTVLVRYAGQDRLTTGDLSRVLIVGNNGTVLPLTAVAQLERSTGPTKIEHDSLRRTVSVLGYYRKGGPGEMALATDVLMGGLAQVSMPVGYGIEMRGDMTEMMASFDRLLSAMKLAVLFIFLLLLAQFRSFTQPLVMLLAIPLQLLGVFGALLLAHQNLSTVSILGVVVANGMAVSNAILLLDLIMRRRAAGMQRDDAILEAGPIRLRPILMTTIVSLIVLAPVAFFPKTGLDAYSPLATVIIGGLTVSTALTLFVVPTLHAVLDDIGTSWRRRSSPTIVEAAHA